MYNSKRLLNLLFAVSIAVHLAAGYAIENKREVESLHKEPSYHGPAKPPHMQYEHPVEHHPDMPHKGEGPNKENPHEHPEGPVDPRSPKGHEPSYAPKPGYEEGKPHGPEKENSHKHPEGPVDPKFPKGHEPSYDPRPGHEEGKPHPVPSKPATHALWTKEPTGDKPKEPDTPFPKVPLTDPVPPQYPSPKPRGPRPPPHQPSTDPLKDPIPPRYPTDKPKGPENPKPLPKPLIDPVPPKYVAPKPLEPPNQQPIPELPTPDKKPTPPVEVPGYKSPMAPVPVPKTPIVPAPTTPIKNPFTSPVEASPVLEMPSYHTEPHMGSGGDGKI